MTLPLWAYAAGGSLLAGSLAGWTVRDWKADSNALDAKDKAFAQYQALTGELAEASLRYEYLTQDLRASERTDRETIREIYRDKIIPAECAVDPAAVSLLDNAVRDANATATGKPRSDLPPTP